MLLCCVEIMDLCKIDIISIIITIAISSHNSLDFEVYTLILMDGDVIIYMRVMEHC